MKIFPTIYCILLARSSAAPSAARDPFRHNREDAAALIISSPEFTCSAHRITISVEYDNKPKETRWFLDRAVAGDWDAVTEHYASEGDTAYSESICLSDGKYEFAIYDDYHIRDGICCGHGEGSYNVTIDGLLLVEGGDFGWREETIFSLPFAQPTLHPSISTSPSISPTEYTCSGHQVTIAVEYDDKPWETVWYLDRRGNDVCDTVKEHRGASGCATYSESFCLQDGEHEFQIYNVGNDGICCDHGEGHYNVTVDGTLVVEGGEFGYKEGTIFSLPFDPATNVTTQSTNP